MEITEEQINGFICVIMQMAVKKPNHFVIGELENQVV
jgi:hypothetical protein